MIYSFPARNFKVIGVTGTNGKTTTAFLVHRMLNEAGYKVGLMSTVGYGVGDNITTPPDHYTNVPTPIMMKRLKQLKGQGAEWLVMEATSMALAQNRLWGVPFHLAVMTNISQDHLDYHKTMENYIQAKVKLFRLTNNNNKGLRTGVINADDATVAQFAPAVSKAVTYGINNGDIRANDIKLSAAELQYLAVTGDESYAISSRLSGKFNVYNTLATVGVGQVLGLNKQQIEQGIASLDGVPGRMTPLQAGQNFNVLVDFAHTPDALKNALIACRDMTKGRVIVVFGATGDRDKGKRPVMGQVAAQNADLIFLTDDETYTEDPVGIIKEVNIGIEQANGTDKTTVIGDRLAAIKAAFASAKAGDTVLLAGIGHQTSRNMGGKEVAWNELQIAKDLLTGR